jgi:hypothetical protein
MQALLPVIRESLYLTRHDVGNAGIAAVCGAIASRVMMGNMVDMFGPRYGFSFLLLLTAPAIYCMALVSSRCHRVQGDLGQGFCRKGLSDSHTRCWYALTQQGHSMSTHGAGYVDLNVQREHITGHLGCVFNTHPAAAIGSAGVAQSHPKAVCFLTAFLRVCSVAVLLLRCADGAGFIIARLFIGFSLAAFVCCQFW